MNWNLILEIAACIAGIATFVFAIPAIMIWQLYYRKANRNPAEILSDGRIEFAPRSRALLIWIGFAVYSAYVAVASFRRPHGSDWGWIAVGILGMIALEHLISFPGTIVVTRESLEQVYWLRRNKRIIWSRIVEINTGKKIKTITITGEDGTQIVHTVDLPDRARLLIEIKRHCTDQLPPDFPREPLEAK